MAPKPPPVKVAQAEKPPPPPPPDAAPPPPNDAPPPEQPSKPVPLVVGISMSSTTSAGGFAAPVGNTVYGKTGDKAADPKDVKAYSAPKYVPVYQVDTEPRVASEVKIPYPDEARRAGIEGTVMLSITIDNEGRVVKAVIVKGPGYGLDEAARDALHALPLQARHQERRGRLHGDEVLVHLPAGLTDVHTWASRPPVDARARPPSLGAPVSGVESPSLPAEDAG